MITSTQQSRLTHQSHSKTQVSRWVTLGLLAGLSTLVTGSFQAAIAQSTTPQPLQEFQPQNTDKSTGIFNNGSGSSSGGMFDLIHRAMQAPSQSSEDFTDSQADSLNTAAQDFLKKRQEMLQSPQPAASTPAAPAAPTQN